MRDFRETAFAFQRACDAARVPVIFVGGVAVMAWGQPRATADVDVLLLLDRAAVEGLVACLAAESLTVTRADLLDAIEDGSHATVFDEKGRFHVDVKLARTAAEAAQVAAGIAVDVGGSTLRVARPEDVIAFKLLYGSPQDLQDVRSILVRQRGRLDEARLRARVRELGVETALADALRDATP